MQYEVHILENKKEEGERAGEKEQINTLLEATKQMVWICLLGNRTCNYFNMLLDNKVIMFYQVAKDNEKGTVWLRLLKACKNVQCN